MTAQDFIATGLIEAYVLGAASEEERREVERMSALHPEVREALELAENDLEAYALAHAVNPRTEMRERVLGAIGTADPGNAGGRVLPLDNGRPRFVFGRTAAAAVIFLLLGSVAYNLYLFNEIRKSEDAATAARSSSERLRDSIRIANEASHNLAARVDSMNVSLRHSFEALRTLHNPSTIVMSSVKDDAPGAKAVVYWCSESHIVCIDPLSLPVGTDPGKEYQLWAIVDGKPVSVGVFSSSGSPEIKMMQVVPKADAFAVTLEKKGGVPAPEGPMYVMAKI